MTKQRDSEETYKESPKKGIMGQGKKEEDFIEGRRLHDYPIGRKFTTRFPFRILDIPDGYEIVKYGFRGIKHIDISDRNKAWYGRGKGWHMLWGLGGLYQTAVVLDTRVQQEDICAQKLLTKDPVPIDQVDTIMHYRVYDPERTLAMASADPMNLLRNIAKARIVRYVGERSIFELQAQAKKTKEVEREIKSNIGT